MFGFLKDKLKNLFGKSEENVKEKAKPKKKTEKKIKTPEKEKKVEKKKRTKEELKQERQITDKLVEDISKENLQMQSPEERIEELEKEKIIEAKEEKRGFFDKLKSVFAYTLTEDKFEELFSELEMLLLESNVALEVVEKLHDELKTELVGKNLKKEKIELEVKEALKKSLENILINPENPLEQIKDFKKISKEPFVILFFGINGAGKTTSIAKLANLLIKNKISCVLAAGDTFRAAAVEQISIHGDKLGVKVIKHEYNSDPSSVGFDAIKYAKQNNIDVVLIDTAGRMHTKENLLHEMEKICRVTKPNLKVFVAEAVAGNDATEQAKAFNDMIGIDGSILSKVDVDEKGGTIISISYITKKPILYLGLGQKYEDLELFDKKKFIERLGL
ncbi:MAG: signal recognition particle-docking protein FtsY [archaeon]|nr:signal recognition particle-docking protein FtsY [archaeon]